MTTNSGDPIEIYRARSLPEAHALRSFLESEGILARIDNEALQDAVGGLHAGWGTALRILVRPADEAAARAVLQRFLKEAGKKKGGGASEEQPATTGSKSAVALAPLERRALWAEVAAVAAVGIVPNLVATLEMVANPTPPPPYWLDAVQLTVLSGCTIFVTLYLIGRSGEPWKRFGLLRPRLSDIPLGVGLFLVAEALWLFFCGRLPWGGSQGSGVVFPRPLLPEDYALMLLKFGANGFAEELVSRAYLITRLEQLLGSRAAALLLSAVPFAAYHGYLGTANLMYSMGFAVVYGLAFLLFRRLWPLAVGHLLCNTWVDLTA
jgi:membrane protease YdiL (CAAX protease family)